jgi:hypothetical protein
MAVIKWSAPGALTTALDTGLNSLASNAIAQSSAIASSVDRYADFELVVSYAVAPSVGSGVELYALQSLDGTNFNDATDPIGNNQYIGIFPLRNVTGAQRVILRHCLLPTGSASVQFKIAVKNAAGQAMAASGNTVKYVKYGEEVV